MSEPSSHRDRAELAEAYGSRVLKMTNDQIIELIHQHNARQAMSAAIKAATNKLPGFSVAALMIEELYSPKRYKIVLELQEGPVRPLHRLVSDKHFTPPALPDDCDTPVERPAG